MQIAIEGRGNLNHIIDDPLAPIDTTYTQWKQRNSVDISPSIQLKNCLLIPDLSNKLLSISQLTKELDCNVLLTSFNCIVQDAQTGRSLGVVLREEDYIMWMRQVKKVKRRLLMGLLTINYGCGTNI